MTEDEMIHSDSEDQRWFTIVLNKAISSHKAKVAPEMLIRKRLCGFELTYYLETYLTF
jgi:hypothetical protein